MDDSLACLFILLALAYFPFPIWAAIRASQRGYPGWAALSFLSMMVGLGPLGGLLAFLATLEASAAKPSRTVVDVDGLRYQIKRILYRPNDARLIILFGVSNIDNRPRMVDSQEWKLRSGSREFQPINLYSVSNQFSGKKYYVTLNPGLSETDMIVAFDIPSNVVKKGNVAGLLIPQANGQDYEELSLLF